MKKSLLSIRFLSIITMFPLLITGCKELTEVNLSGRQVAILAPVDALITNSTINSFAWDVMDGAKSYQLQIVSPRFDSVTRFVLDTTITKTTYTATLSPAVYEWRIRGINNSSQSAYTTRKITIQ